MPATLFKWNGAAEESEKQEYSLHENQQGMPVHSASSALKNDCAEDVTSWAQEHSRIPLSVKSALLNRAREDCATRCERYISTPCKYTVDFSGSKLIWGGLTGRVMKSVLQVHISYSLEVVDVVFLGLEMKNEKLRKKKRLSTFSTKFKAYPESL